MKFFKGIDFDFNFDAIVVKNLLNPEAILVLLVVISLSILKERELALALLVGYKSLIIFQNC